MAEFVVVAASEVSTEEKIELPIEENGSLLLSVLQSQFSGASGLKYRNVETGSWRAVRLAESVLLPPDPTGWKDITYYVVVASPSRSSPEPIEAVKKLKLSPHTSDLLPQASELISSDLGQDLVVLGLEWSVSTDEMKSYFEEFGEVVSAEVKFHPLTGKSRGFGFVRFKDSRVNTIVCAASHYIKCRSVEVRLPNDHKEHPTKLFVGCLPLSPRVSSEELEKYFTEFGSISDVYIPEPYRGFGFVTFTDPEVAQRVMSLRHQFRSSSLNLSFAEPKGRGGCRPQTRPQTRTHPQESSRFTVGGSLPVSSQHHNFQQPQNFRFYQLQNPVSKSRGFSSESHSPFTPAGGYSTFSGVPGYRSSSTWGNNYRL